MTGRKQLRITHQIKDFVLVIHCCIKDTSKISRLKQHTYHLTISEGQKSWHSLAESAELGFFPRLQPRCWRGLPSLKAQLGKDNSSPHEAVSRIQFLQGCWTERPAGVGPESPRVPCVGLSSWLRQSSKRNQRERAGQGRASKVGTTGFDNLILEVMGLPWWHSG